MFLARAAVVAVAGMALVGAGGCKSKGKVDKAPIETQTATATPATGEPMTVTGCLRAGDGADTFVLEQAAQNGSTEVANYQLVGKPGVDFRDNMGKRVQVTGTLGAEADIASRAPATTEPKAKGTSGTPVVQTQENVQVRTLRVDSLTAQGGSCPRK
jgi:hypothetical protein